MQSHYVQSGFMLELAHCGWGTTLGDFDRCVHYKWVQLSTLRLSVCIVQVWWSPKLRQWLMHGIPLRPVVLPVWGFCCPLRGLSTSSRLRLSTERSDWLRERWRPLPKGRVRQGRRGRRAGVSNQRSVINGLYLGHNRDVIGHPEQHQPNLGLLLCCQYWCAVNVCCADVYQVFKSSDGMTNREKTHQNTRVWAKHTGQMKKAIHFTLFGLFLHCF